MPEALSGPGGFAVSVARSQVLVEGIVQGVGFRPFVYLLAKRLALAGFVANNQSGVIIEIEGAEPAIEGFIARLVDEAPPLARIHSVARHRIAPKGVSDFVIVESPRGGARATLISPDIATCAHCLRELGDPRDRRHRYPFINCTNCGPRFTITRDVPYDRPSTTMADFPMCAACAAEYHDPSDRRFHAQPISCPDCGPRLRLVSSSGQEQTGNPLECAAELLRAGYIVAIKGLGGYHLAAAATNEGAVSALRSRKHREDKPFAVMVADIKHAHRIALLDSAEERVISSICRPIVLLRRQLHTQLASAIAPGNRFIGTMLPYTPLHHLICDLVGGPIVLTSGNLSDEPIAYEDDKATTWLAPIADFFLMHDRPIHIRSDDSVLRVVRGREMLIRRSRGYAPSPLLLPLKARRPILACGGELKNTFCLVKDQYALISHHIGDLENYQTLRAFSGGIEHFKRIFDIRPKVVAYDLHPEYLSTKFALELDGVEMIGVQHHHAHVAACLADNGEQGPVIGVAFDGLGYGLDRTLWGGEFLIADLANCKRAAHFEPVAMPGGVAAVRQPWRMALAYLDAAYGDQVPADLDIVLRNGKRWDSVLAMLRSRVNSPMTSSVGRLFDAAAAIAGVRDYINYEGQASIEFEQRMDPSERGSYHARISESSPLRIRGTDLICSIVEDVRRGVTRAIVAARFHNGLADLIGTVCDAIRGRSGLSTVALSGGVFQNIVLLGRAIDRLEQRGFRVLTHSKVPTNDGGISFGQAVVAVARDRQPAFQSLLQSGRAEFFEARSEPRKRR